MSDQPVTRRDRRAHHGRAAAGLSGRLPARARPQPQLRAIAGRAVVAAAADHRHDRAVASRSDGEHVDRHRRDRHRPGDRERAHVRCRTPPDPTRHARAPATRSPCPQRCAAASSAGCPRSSRCWASRAPSGSWSRPTRSCCGRRCSVCSAAHRSRWPSRWSPSAPVTMTRPRPFRAWRGRWAT